MRSAESRPLVFLPPEPFMPVSPLRGRVRDICWRSKVSLAWYGVGAVLWIVWMLSQ